jgi:MFS family permease
VSYGAAGALISGYALARLAMDPFAGRIVDRVGEQTAAIAGLLVVAAMSVFTGLATTYVVALVFWSVGGAGSALVFASLFSYLLKVVPKRRMARTLSVFYGAMNIGLVAGTPVGGIVAHAFGLNVPLFFYAGVLCAAALVFWLLVPPARRTSPDERDGAIGMWTLLRRPGFAATVMSNFAYLWMVGAVYDTLVPLFAHAGLGLSTEGIGVILAIALVAEFAVLYPTGHAADRLGRRPVMLLALPLLAVVVAALGWSGTPFVFGALMAGLGLVGGVAGVPPAAMLSDVSPEGGSGAAVGLFRFFGDLGFVVGPLTAGFVATASGFRSAFVAAALPILIAFVFVVRSPETMARPDPGRGVA